MKIHEIGPNPKIGRSVKRYQDTAMGQPQGTKFVHSGYQIEFTPTALNIYRGTELVYTLPGDYSNPTNLDKNAAKAKVTRLIDKR